MTTPFLSMENPSAKYNEPARRLADRIWATKTYRYNHHWARLEQCANALKKFDDDNDTDLGWFTDTRFLFSANPPID